MVRRRLPSRRLISSISSAGWDRRWQWPADVFGLAEARSKYRGNIRSYRNLLEQIMVALKVVRSIN